jgi:hypothetical protein
VCNSLAIAGKAVLAIAVSSEAMPTPIASDSMAQPRAPGGRPSSPTITACFISDNRSP